MAKNWQCGRCEAIIDTQDFKCGWKKRRSACPLWWRPATWWQKFRCAYLWCSCPHGADMCIKCTTLRIGQWR